MYLNLETVKSIWFYYYLDSNIKGWFCKTVLGPFVTTNQLTTCRLSKTSLLWLLPCFPSKMCFCNETVSKIAKKWEYFQEFWKLEGKKKPSNFLLIFVNKVQNQPIIQVIESRIDTKKLVEVHVFALTFPNSVVFFGKCSQFTRKRNEEGHWHCPTAFYYLHVILAWDFQLVGNKQREFDEHSIMWRKFLR